MINIDNLINGTYCTYNINKPYVQNNSTNKSKRKIKSKFKFNTKILNV